MPCDHSGMLAVDQIKKDDDLDFELDNYMLSGTENLIETDFWNIDIDSLENEQEYFNNMAYFLMDEGYTWEAVELLDQFKLIEKESL